MHPEDYFDRLGKSLGLKKEMEVGETEFDNKFFIKGNDNVILYKFLTRDIRKKITSLGCGIIKCETKRDKLKFEIMLHRSVCSEEGLYEAKNLIDSIIDKLYELKIV